MDNIYEEKVSGATRDRPILGQKHPNWNLYIILSIVKYSNVIYTISNYIILESGSKHISFI